MSQKSKLPMDIKRMLHVAKKYNVWVDALTIPAKVQRNFPAWYSRGAEKPLRGFMRKETTKCLIKSHKIRKIKHLVKSSGQLRNNTQGQHCQKDSCICKDCKDDQEKGCTMPHKCTRAAWEMERSIFQKFCLTDQPLNDDGLLLTPKRLEENKEARKEY